ncbi:MAG: P27 family phage terminase small subunit [Nitrospira sp.]|nr:P27 family phage terminase small subunit [Nitrospira sp.]
MKGRKPKDIALKLLQGNASKRPVPQTGDPFVLEDVPKPDNLDPLASAEWDRLTQDLAPILCAASRGMLLCAVNAFSQLVSADKVIQEKGLTYETCGESGPIIRMRPEVRVRDTARAAYHKALTELGASPVSHGRVKRLPDNNQTDLPGIAKFFD